MTHQSATTPAQVLVEETKKVSARHGERRKTLIKKTGNNKKLMLVYATVTETNTMCLMQLNIHMADNFYNEEAVCLYPQQEKKPFVDKDLGFKRTINLISTGKIDTVYILGDIFTEEVKSIRNTCYEHAIELQIDSNRLAKRIQEWLHPEKK